MPDIEKVDTDSPVDQLVGALMQHLQVQQQLIPMPWWAKMYVQVGFPTALAILLVSAMLGWLPSPIMQSLSRLEQLSAQQTYLVMQQTALMRAICYNTDGAVKQSVSCEPWQVTPPVQKP